MRISLLVLILCISVGLSSALADIVDYSLSGPFIPASSASGSSWTGTFCPGPTYSSPCVLSGETPQGDPWAIQSVELDHKSTTGPGGTDTWKLTINEEAPLSWNANGVTYNSTAFGDFLFQDPAANGPDFGIVLGGTCTGDSHWDSGTPDTGVCGGGSVTYNGHNSLVAGGVYQQKLGLSYPNMYQTSTFGRVGQAIWVSGANMNLISSSNSFTVDRLSILGGTGGVVQYATYTLTDTFTVPQGTISDSGNLLMDVSSYFCNNWVDLGPPTTVPEPRALFLIIPAILLLGRRLSRSVQPSESDLV